MWTSYPGFEGQKDLGQKQDKAFQANGDELQHKIGDSHHPDQVEEVIAVEVGSGKYETGGGEKQFYDLPDAEFRQQQWCKSFWEWNDGIKKDNGKKLTEHHKITPPESNKVKKHTHTHTCSLTWHKNNKTWCQRPNGDDRSWHTQPEQRQQLALPVVQLLLTKRVVDVHNISCKEDDDPQSNEHRAFLLKYQSLLVSTPYENTIDKIALQCFFANRVKRLNNLAWTIISRIV